MKKDGSFYSRNKTVTIETANKWLMAVYAHSVSSGFFVISSIKIPGAAIYLMGARQMNLIEKCSTESGPRNRWIDLDSPPHQDMSNDLFKYYLENANRAEYGISQIDRIEEKLDKLLTMWL